MIKIQLDSIRNVVIQINGQPSLVFNQVPHNLAFTTKTEEVICGFKDQAIENTTIRRTQLHAIKVLISFDFSLDQKPNKSSDLRSHP